MEREVFIDGMVITVTTVALPRDGDANSAEVLSTASCIVARQWTAVASIAPMPR
jgi:hypothetical protein